MPRAWIFASAVHTFRGGTHRGSRGQVIVMFALTVTVFLVVLGGSLDLAAIYLERGRMQNAADSAALAGAQTLSDGGTPVATITSASSFLVSNGFPADVSKNCLTGNPCVQIYPAPATAGGSPQGSAQIVDVSVGTPYQTSFLGLIGMHALGLQVDAQASSAARRFDIFLSIDQSFSLSDGDIAQLISAAHLFVQALNPTSDPYSPKIAIAAFQGVRYTAEYPNMANNGKDTLVGLTDSLILTQLTNNRHLLDQLIGDPSNPGCPSIPADQAWMPYTVYPAGNIYPPPNTPANEGRLYGSGGVYTSPDPLGQGIDVEQFTNGYPSFPPTLSSFACPLQQGSKASTSGRFIRNGITAAFVPTIWNPYTQRSDVWDAFSSLHGGRDLATTQGTTQLPAKRILIVMTDGTNTILPIPSGSACVQPPTSQCAPEVKAPGTPSVSFARYGPQMLASQTGTYATEADDATVAAATTAKLGPDGKSDIGQSDTLDDVEIYTIGFFGGTESGLVAGPTPLCPAPVLTAAIQSQMHSDDFVLRDVSSSSPNSCDHYFPVARSASQQNGPGLPAIFSSIAGRIKRAQLVTVPTPTPVPGP